MSPIHVREDAKAFIISTYKVQLFGDPENFREPDGYIDFNEEVEHDLEIILENQFDWWPCMSFKMIGPLQPGDKHGNYIWPNKGMTEHEWTLQFTPDVVAYDLEQPVHEILKASLQIEKESGYFEGFKLEHLSTLYTDEPIW